VAIGLIGLTCLAPELWAVTGSKVTGDLLISTGSLKVTLPAYGISVGTTVAPPASGIRTSHTLVIDGVTYLWPSTMGTTSTVLSILNTITGQLGWSAAGAGSGDLTDVNAGNLIDVTDPTGPAPTVAVDLTEMGAATTFGDGLDLQRFRNGCGGQLRKRRDWTQQRHVSGHWHQHARTRPAHQSLGE
jgi:hypothetical protein